MVRKKILTVKEGWVPRTHGIPSTYNRGCRCDLCRACNSRRVREGGYVNKLHQRRFAERIEVDGKLVSPTGEHGTSNLYQNRGCRCNLCVAAAKAYNHARRQIK